MGFSVTPILFIFLITWNVNCYRLKYENECPGIIIEDVCPNRNVTFWLYNLQVSQYELYTIPDIDYDSVLEAPIINEAPTVFILHGYTKSQSEEPNQVLRPPYMVKGYNIISVDYSNAVPEPCYTQAVTNSDTIAKCIAYFIVELIKRTSVKITDIHLIGLSLGAHIAGKTGIILKQNGLIIPRITSLDIAGPLFLGPWSYVTTKSAKFVEAIHTNIPWFGKVKTNVHAEFFVTNPSANSTTCDNNDSSDNKCLQDMAPVYYAESILTIKKCFCGRSEPNKEMIMGEHTPSTTLGKFYVTTNQKPPYAKDYTCLNNTVEYSYNSYQYCEQTDPSTKKCSSS